MQITFTGTTKKHADKVPFLQTKSLTMRQTEALYSEALIPVDDQEEQVPRVRILSADKTLSPVLR